MAKAVGGFALTLPIHGINLFLCRRIYHVLHRISRSAAVFPLIIAHQLVSSNLERVCVLCMKPWTDCREEPGWGAGVGLRCWCPVTLMGADGSKNRKVSSLKLLVAKVWRTYGGGFRVSMATIWFPKITTVAILDGSALIGFNLFLSSIGLKCNAVVWLILHW